MCALPHMAIKLSPRFKRHQAHFPYLVAAHGKWLWEQIKQSRPKKGAPAEVQLYGRI